MSEKPTSRISLAKFGSPASANGTRPPQKVMLAVGALVLTAIAALGAAASLFGVKDQLLSQALTANAKLKKKDRSTTAEIMHQVDITPRGILLQTAVVAVALLFVARSTYRGKYWARWGVLGLWVLATFVQTVPGFANSILGVAGSTPIFYKSLAFISGAAFVAAVILTSVRSSVEFFNQSRPARGPGQPARRGLFASRASALTSTAPPPVKPTKPAKPATAAGRIAALGTEGASKPAERSQPDRSKSKARANTESVARGAELARSRAKAASKSRRSGS